MTHEWTVRRCPPNGQVVLGEFDLGTGLPCSSLERLAVMIPEGRYRVELTDSGRAHQFVQTHGVTGLWAPYDDCRLPELLNVPGRSAIRVHCGNSIADSSGCILVAADHSATELEASRPALTRVVNALRDAEAAGDDAWLTVRSAT